MPLKPPSSAMIRMIRMMTPMLMAFSSCGEGAPERGFGFQSNSRGKSRPPGFGAGRCMEFRLSACLQPIQDLVGPEALEPVQRLVKAGELVSRDPADLLDGAD